MVYMNINHMKHSNQLKLEEMYQGNYIEKEIRINKIKGPVKESQFFFTILEYAF